MAKAYICDRCGDTYLPSALGATTGTLCVILAYGYDNEVQRHNGRFDLCKECYEELNNWLTDPHYEIKHFPPLMEVE